MNELLEQNLLEDNIIGLSQYNHQTEAINKTLEYFSDDSNSRGKIIMPCGSGKSLTSFWVLEQLRLLRNVNRTIITVPNLILQAQIFKTFYSSLSETHNFICIGSDKDVAGNYVDDEVTVTTCEKEIKSFLKYNKRNQVIIIATYQSLNIISEICNEYNYELDLAIIDEAHRTVGSKEKCFSTILFNEEIKIKKRLFMTATEKVYVGKDDTIIGMDNPEFYGKIIYEYTLPQAIKDEILCDYQVATIYSTNEEIIEFINSNKYLNSIELGLSDKEYKNIMCSLLATIRAIREKGCKKIVTYHNTIKKAKIFKDLLDKVIANNILNIGTFHINGTQSSKDKHWNIKSFENSFVAVLTNSQALVEGIDIPCIDCVVFADKREATVGIIQATGRSLRKFEGKNKSYIVIPILTETEDDIYIENSEFYRLFNILISLSIMDERVLHEIKNINIGNGSSSTRIIENIIDIDNKFKDKITGLISKINLKVWNKFESPFLSYEDAKKWVQENLVSKGIDSSTKYRKTSLPKNIPKCPDIVYGRKNKNKGWKGWGDYLGVNKQFLPFDEARKWVQENLVPIGINTWTKYMKYDLKKHNELIPKCPNNTYKKEWKGWTNWFDKDNLSIKYKKLYNYEESKKWVQENLIPKGIDTSIKLRKAIKNKEIKIPIFIPKTPNSHYKKKGVWKGWGDWFGTGNLGNGDAVYLTYEEAKKWVQKNIVPTGIRGQYYWQKGKFDLPAFIPKAPDVVYGNRNKYKKSKGWKGWGDFLGTGNPSRNKEGYLTYEEAKEWIQKNIPKKIRNSSLFIKHKKLLPLSIPRNPFVYYTTHRTWKGFTDFLGTESQTKNCYDYDKCKKWVTENKLTKNIKTVIEWQKITKKLPIFIPKSPMSYYKRRGTWKGWRNFIGNNKK